MAGRRKIRNIRNGFRRPGVAAVVVIRTSDDVIELAGGPTALARRFGVSTQAVCNWRERGLPTHTYPALSKWLQAHGHEAPRSLWRFIRQTDLIE